MIYDMQLETWEILQGINELKLVLSDYPDSWSKFPMAIYRTKRTTHFKDAHKREIQSAWIITVEIYDDDKAGDLTSIVTKIDEKFKSIGFVGNDTDANVADLSRKILEYRGIVDNDTHFVYQK
ncbi:hypothetical protein [Enterococcus olivae]